MLVSLYGTRSYKEIVGAMLLHLVGYWLDGQGLSVIYNYLGGVRLLQRNPPYEAILVLMWDAYDVTLTWDPTSQITFLSHIAHVLSFSLGVLSAQFKLV